MFTAALFMFVKSKVLLLRTCHGHHMLPRKSGDPLGVIKELKNRLRRKVQDTFINVQKSQDRQDVTLGSCPEEGDEEKKRKL